MECPACDGTGFSDAVVVCTVCDGSGKFPITSCPRELVNADQSARDFFELYGHFDTTKHFPRGGGTLDQTQSFLDAVRFVRHAEAELKLAKLKDV